MADATTSTIRIAAPPEQVMEVIADFAAYPTWAEQINEVLLETGAVLSGAMLRAGLIDELVVYMAPHLMGDGARGLFHMPGLDAMDRRLDVEIRDLRAVGADWRITATPCRQSPP